MVGSPRGASLREAPNQIPDPSTWSHALECDESEGKTQDRRRAGEEKAKARRERLRMSLRRGERYDK